ncbi:Flagellar motility protein MotE, a chaperone for MotC folding [Rhizobiales bacterium GAS191]|nr:Flagellar motility protein MotE, a chaperone for MotC folding [Rhizobiales bacterium GAS191]
MNFARASISHRFGWLVAVVIAAAPGLVLGKEAPKPGANAKPLALHPPDRSAAKRHKLAKHVRDELAPAAQAAIGNPGGSASAAPGLVAPGLAGQPQGTGGRAAVAAAAGAPGAPAMAAPSASAPGAKAPVASAEPTKTSLDVKASPDVKISPDVKAAPDTKPTSDAKGVPGTKPGIPAIISVPSTPMETKKPAGAPPASAPAASLPVPSAASVGAPAASPQSQLAATQNEAQQYCSNIAATAADARFAWQAKRLTELDAQLKQRIAELEAKQAEYKDWLQKRQEFEKKAAESVVAIYSRMRPEAAAAQLAAMDDGTAAAILVKLNARSAGAILNEMDAGRAARLTDAMANFPNAARDGKKS